MSMGSKIDLEDFDLNDIIPYECYIMMREDFSHRYMSLPKGIVITLSRVKCDKWGGDLMSALTVDAKITKKVNKEVEYEYGDFGKPFDINVREFITMKFRKFPSEKKLLEYQKRIRKINKVISNE